MFFRKKTDKRNTSRIGRTKREKDREREREGGRKREQFRIIVVFLEKKKLARSPRWSQGRARSRNDLPCSKWSVSVCPSKKNARPCTHVETLVARWKSRGPPVDTRALHAGKLVAEWFRVSVGSPSSSGRRGEEKEDGEGRGLEIFWERERKTRARKKLTFSFAACDPSAVDFWTS